MPQLALGIGKPEYSLFQETTLNGISFAVPPGANLIGWQVTLSSPPAVTLSVALYGSIDNISWFLIDSSTSVTGDFRTVLTAALYVKVSVLNASGGGLRTVSIVAQKNPVFNVMGINAATGNVIQPAGGQILMRDGTLSLPSLSFISDAAIGIYKYAANLIGIKGWTVFNSNITMSAGTPVINMGSGGQIVGLTGSIAVRSIDTTKGFALNTSTDGVMKVRNKDDSLPAQVDALGYKAGGVAGVSFGPAAPASITVVNGIVTAIS